MSDDYTDTQILAMAEIAANPESLLEALDGIPAKYTQSRRLTASIYLLAASEKARRDALEEAVGVVCEAVSPFHDGRDTGIFWRTQSDLAAAIRSLNPAVTPTESNPTPKENEL